MAIDKTLKEINEADLGTLCSAGARESKSLEFKREINLADDSAKRKFFASVASFANTQGGDIIFGIDAKDGVAASLRPLSNFNPDGETIRLRDLIRAHIEPKVYGFDFQAVPLNAGGHVLVLRIPRTWVGAHMVTFGQDNRFYIRDNNGKRIMDVSEVRMAFSAPETLPERVRRFRLDRLSAITGGDVPKQLSSASALVFHVVPIKAFDSFYECDLEALVKRDKKNREYLRSIGNQNVDLSYDLDGVFKCFGPKNSECDSYTKLFRSGILEVVSCSVVEEWRHKGSFLPFQYESHLCQMMPSWLGAMQIAQVEPPAFAALALIGMAGKFPFLGYYSDDYDRRPIRHDPLLIPPSLIESLEIDAKKILMPIFNRVWQACGIQHSASFNEKGKWNKFEDISN
jgi:hypothetical protein